MGHIILSFIFFNIILHVIHTRYKKGEDYINKKDLIFFTILLIAFGTYGGGEGDYLHYGERVKLFQNLYDVYYYDMMEIQYNYLAYFLKGNYNLWRFVIFSIQFVGLSCFLYKAKLNTYPVLLCFVSYCLIASVYNRSFWGVIYFFGGVYLLLEKKNPLFLIIISLCYVSHTQNLALLLLLPLAFFDLKKWQLIFVFLFFGAIVTVLKDNFTTILFSGGLDNEYMTKKVSEYGESGFIVHGVFGDSIGEQVIFALRYLPMTIFIVSWMLSILNQRDKYISLSTPFRRIMNITIGLFLLAIIIFFASIGTGTYVYRILAMSLFPISILLPYMLRNGIISKHSFNRYIAIFIACSELSYIKDIYYAYAGGM